MKENKKWKYIVWVGGCDDYYSNYKKAKQHYDEWINKGYNDVIIEKIEEMGNETIHNRD
jgi:hypothetical protein|tara:strand:+ start:279 stop:455 length:177 start_codon:yes stop_codon:yes gene_type:complete